MSSESPAGDVSRWGLWKQGGKFAMQSFYEVMALNKSHKQRPLGSSLSTCGTSELGLPHKRAIIRNAYCI